MKVKSKRVPVAKTVTESEFTIKLSEEEACALGAILGQIGGHFDGPDNPRLHTDPLWEALTRGGMEDSPDYQRFCGHFEGEVRP